MRYLIVVYGPELAADRPEWHALDVGTVIIGRDPGDGGIALDDVEVSRQHAELSYVRASDTYRLRDLGSRNRTHAGGTAIDSEALHHGSVVRIGGSLLVYAELAPAPGVPPFEPEGVGSLALFNTEAAAVLAAPSALPILIQGQTGTGKELLARLIHEKSGRAGALVNVNCSSFSRDLLGSELFGHVAGAFSGAVGPRRGLFASADQGTLFLDEIGELPLDQQPALLRALQEGKIRPVGSDGELSVDVRVVAATHQDLEGRAARGEFREDLYARLAGFTVETSPLSERREEILGLFATFLGKKSAQLDRDAAEALLLYDWPKNIRELKHVAERTRLVARSSDHIGLELLPPAIQEVLPGAGGDGDTPAKAQLEALLEEHMGSVADVARALGKHRQQVYRWLRRYEISAAKYRRG